MSRQAVCRALAIGAALLLGSCGPLSREDPLERVASCPRALVLADAAEATVFREGAGRDLTDVVARLRIADVTVDCRHDPQGAKLDLQVALTADRGAANTVGRQEAEYFVAVVDPEGNVLQRQSFAVAFAWPDNRLRTGVVEELEPRIAKATRATAGGYRVWVGLQLTEDQLAWNRGGGSRRR
ncbi:MAG: hypothetical protein ACK51F_12855 [Rhodospirillales bacterium]